MDTKIVLKTNKEENNVRIAGFLQDEVGLTEALTTASNLTKENIKTVKKYPDGDFSISTENYYIDIVNEDHLT
jgi:hypothetical protein